MSTEFPCPECGETLPPFTRSCACGWHAQAKPKAAASTNCACGRFGIVKRDGLWLCGICAGVPPRAVGNRISFRERWYQERGLPYEPPRLSNIGAWRHVGRSAKAGERVMRESGEDTPEDIGHERSVA